MKIINNDFYTNNWQDFVHSWVMKKVDNLVQRYDLPVDADTIENFRIQTNEVGTHDFVFNYTKDDVKHTLTITPKNDDVEISIMTVTRLILKTVDLLLHVMLIILPRYGQHIKMK